MEQVQHKFTVADYTPEEVENELNGTIYMPSVEDLSEFYEINTIPALENDVEYKEYMVDLATRIRNNSDEVKLIIRNFYYSQPRMS
jgi:hypothetical protein